MKAEASVVAILRHVAERQSFFGGCPMASGTTGDEQNPGPAISPRCEFRTSVPVDTPRAALVPAQCSAPGIEGGEEIFLLYAVHLCVGDPFGQSVCGAYGVRLCRRGLSVRSEESPCCVIQIVWTTTAETLKLSVNELQRSCHRSH